MIGNCSMHDIAMMNTPCACHESHQCIGRMSRTIATTYVSAFGTVQFNVWLRSFKIQVAELISLSSSHSNKAAVCSEGPVSVRQVCAGAWPGS
eukprot:scaffold81350_cov50-Prasinocladus_malaysianus.AAC.2